MFSNFYNTLNNKLLKENVFKADPLPAVIEVKAVPRSSGTPLLVFAVLTILAERR
jgi:hypothetical protein